MLLKSFRPTLLARNENSQRKRAPVFWFLKGTSLAESRLWRAGSTNHPRFGEPQIDLRVDLSLQPSFVSAER